MDDIYEGLDPEQIRKVDVYRKISAGRSEGGFTLFTNDEEMFDYLEGLDIVSRWSAEKERRTNGVEGGDHVLQIHLPDGYPVIIGATMNLEEYLADERDATSGDEEFDEDYYTERWKDMNSRGYLWGTWTSVWEARGEYGSVHITRLRKIAPETYQALLDMIQIGEQIPTMEDVERLEGERR